MELILVVVLPRTVLSQNLHSEDCLIDCIVGLFSQLMNTIPIKSWSGESEDRELQKLIPYMEKLSAAVRLSICLSLLFLLGVLLPCLLHT